MLYKPLLRLFLKSALGSVYQMWGKNSKDLKKAQYFPTTEPYMTLTVHYNSGELTMRSLQTFFP